MTALIDTHVFVWMDTDSAKLSPTAMRYFADPNCKIVLGVVSVWEVAIKSAKNKLALTGDLEKVLHDIQERNPLHILPLEVVHALEVRKLPAVHNDPFDRMLAAQALVENAVLSTADPIFKQYPIQSDW